MEQSSKDVIARFFEAYAVRDWAALREATTDDVRWHFPGRHPLAGTKEGIGEVIAFFDQMGQMKLRADPYVAGANDSYLVEAQRVYSVDEHDALETESCLLWRLIDGRVASGTHFFHDQ